MSVLFGKWSVSKFIGLAACMLFSVLIAGCGGGGGSPGVIGTQTTTGTTITGSITLALTDSSGASTSLVTISSPLTVTATVLDGNGDPVSGAIVNFSVGSLATLSPSSGAILTNSSGVAKIKLSVKDLQTAQAQVGAADTINAGTTIGVNAVTTSTTYSIGATAITLGLLTPSTGAANVTAYGTQLIKVSVSAGGALYTDQPVVVSFNSACATAGTANLPESASTVNGVAQVVYRDIGCNSVDTVTVSSVGVGSKTVALTVAKREASSIGFVSATPSDKAIVIQGSGGNGRVQTALLTFQVLDTFGKALPNEGVNFKVNSTQPVTLQTTSGTTDIDGKITVSVSSGTSPTTFRVVAALASNAAITAISDSVIVTTGQPVQTAFSLSAEKFGIEGWNFDNITDLITVLMADENGNPVADGTPVLFTTDTGAIGSSSNGGCVTTNGGCSVTFRSQNPRTLGQRNGVATISVSSAIEAGTLFGTIQIYLNARTGSATQALRIFPQPLTTPLVQSATNTLPLALTCGAYAFQIGLVDDNVNPLPPGTTVVASNATGLTVGTIIPATVPDISPPTPLANNGSSHLVPITPNAALCAAGGGHTGTFDLTITSPKGLPVLYSFSLAYP